MIIQGDCLLKLKELEDNSVDSIVTDPPYGLEFMGKEWDKFATGRGAKYKKGGEINKVSIPGTGFTKLPGYIQRPAKRCKICGKQAWSGSPCKCEKPEWELDNSVLLSFQEFNYLWAKECLRVLKPGGHLLAFSGTRTYHRMACAIEDAGFEVRDMIEWVYGSGFPKSLNIGKAVDKLQGNERVEVGRTERGNAPSMLGKSDPNSPNYDGTTFGVGTTIHTKGTSEWEGWGTALKPSHEPICMARKPLAEKTVAENCLKYGTGGINIDVSRVSSDTDAYKNDDNNENNILLHKLSELRCKIYTLLFSFVADKKDFLTPSNDVECVEMWKKLEDCLGDYSVYRHLYDALPHLFLNGDQVSAQQLHDALSDIDRLRKEQKHNLSNQHSDHLSNLDVFYQLILSYLNDTTLYIKKQESVGRFPANILHDNSEEVRECFPEQKSGAKKANQEMYNHDDKEFVATLGASVNEYQASSGNASRFFRAIPNDVVDYNDFLIYNRSILTNIKQLCGQHLTKRKTDIILGGVIQGAERFIQDAELLIFGNSKMEKFLTDTASTIKTLIAQMTELKTLNVLPNWLIMKFTEDYEKTIKLLKELNTEDVKNAESINRLIAFKREMLELIRDIARNVVIENYENGKLQTENELMLTPENINENTKKNIGERKSFKSIIYQAKASKSERNKGCEGLEEKQYSYDGRDKEIENPYQRNKSVATNNHPTVKPIALMEYLIKMITPKGGTVLDPFAGSGSTLVAAKQNGYKYIGIELTPEYIPIIEARLNAIKENRQKALL